jgi:primase-polymerase (primpol)-like protein
MSDVNQFENLPDELRSLPQWVCWGHLRCRDGHAAPKLPINPGNLALADVTDSSTWAQFSTALKVARHHELGLGFVFTANDPYLGVDLDACVSKGVLDSWARRIVRSLHSYTEFSPSGRGVHILLRAALPPGGRHRKGKVEVYDNQRFFAMTGSRVADTPSEIRSRQRELMAIYHKLFGQQTLQSVRTPTKGMSGRQTDINLGAIMRAASNARNGEEFRRLMSGITDGYPSPSEADLALCQILAFWTQDPIQIDRLFRDSGLYRAKWDERHGNVTYGERTIAKALTLQKETYATCSKFDR